MAVSPAPIEDTPSGVKVALKALYVYPDGHANLTFADGTNWPLNDEYELIGYLANALLRPMQKRARQKAGGIILEMNTWTSQALQFVPKGEIAQNSFRAALHNMLMNQLGSDPENPTWSVAETVDIAADRVRQFHPGFEPQYDAQLRELSWPRKRP
jgi:hypothetical protein